MSHDAEKKESDKVLFNSLIMMFAQSAMAQMGELEAEEGEDQPDVEVDLEGAQMTIDLLGMLQSKTHGNLDKQESDMLATTLSGLQLSYVEAAKG